MASYAVHIQWKEELMHTTFVARWLNRIKVLFELRQSMDDGTPFLEFVIRKIVSRSSKSIQSSKCFSMSEAIFNANKNGILLLFSFTLIVANSVRHNECNIFLFNPNIKTNCLLKPFFYSVMFQQKRHKLRRKRFRRYNHVLIIQPLKLTI